MFTSKSIKTNMNDFNDGYKPSNQLCNETAQFCKTALLQGIFQRGDYKYLTKLTAIYLGVEVEKFKFLQPGANHEARFMADCLYLLVLTTLCFITQCSF